MFAAFAKAVAQTSDPAFRRVFWRSLLAAVAIFLLLWALAWLGLDWAGDYLSGWLAARQPGGFWTRVFEWVFGAAGLVAVLIVSFFLFPEVMTLVMALLLEDVAAAVERRHYPEAPAARRQPLGEAVGAVLVFTVIKLGLNILLLPVYLVLLFVPPLNLFVFYLLNGYFDGWEYFELVAVRRYDMATTKRLRRRFRGRLLVAGIVIRFLMSLPLINLATPIVATAYMLHVFEALRRRAAVG